MQTKLRFRRPYRIDVADLRALPARLSGPDRSLTAVSKSDLVSQYSKLMQANG